MDNFCEQLVEKKRTGGDKAKVAVTLGVSILLGAAVIVFAVASGFLLVSVCAIAMIAFGIWLATGYGVEYEYILTNNEMDIDKIKGKRNRERMITVDISKATAYRTLPDPDEKDADVVVYATTGSEKNAQYLICEHSDYGVVKLIFNPDAKMREAIEQELPRSLRQKVTENG